MLNYVLKQAKRGDKFNGKWYGKLVHDETIDLAGLAHHMAAHNSPYSEGAIKGLLDELTYCVRELVLDGIAVKIPDLGKFYPVIQSAPADTEQDWTPAKNVRAILIRCLPHGKLRLIQFGAAGFNIDPITSGVAKFKRLDFYDTEGLAQKPKV